MKPKIRVMLCDDIGERFFGEGPCRLLHRIEETGSLRAAAQAMGLSYSKALRMSYPARTAFFCSSILDLSRSVILRLTVLMALT